MDELISQSKDYLSGKKIKSKNFTKQIAFNLIPHIDEFVDEGYTKEEWIKKQNRERAARYRARRKQERTQENDDL